MGVSKREGVRGKEVSEATCFMLLDVKRERNLIQSVCSGQPGSRIEKASVDERKTS